MENLSLEQKVNWKQWLPVIGLFKEAENMKINVPDIGFGLPINLVGATYLTYQIVSCMGASYLALDVYVKYIHPSLVNVIDKLF